MYIGHIKSHPKPDVVGNEVRRWVVYCAMRESKSSLITLCSFSGKTLLVLHLIELHTYVHTYTYNIHTYVSHLTLHTAVIEERESSGLL